MRFALRRNNSTKRLSRAAGAVAALTVGASLLAAPTASAADTPSTRQLLDACGWADLCDFHPQSYWTYTGPRHQVGSTAYNCGTQTNQHRIDWSDTTGATNSVGVSISASAKFWGVYEASVEASYSHSWEASHTDTESNTVNIPAGHVGWMERGTAKQQATGWYEIHFSEPYYGHYVWYVQNYQSSGFNSDRPDLGYVNFKDRAMTSGERGAHC
ncbi:hypothetical protein [Streptomyces sp. AS02]|uniref:hypothetical protein n=1 Tax=Streptomyces sp. AS02 TaxID=2938946 RepID=UPI00202218DA|nr:hypothetical protein [Streptomyces sp. AS02]MCL8014922.1 hypothetical protein [Streptomyces sp. AS02]